jgi:hypothetical protein
MNSTRTLLGRFFSLLIAVAGVSGCLPRGEAHSVDEIFTDARSSYNSVSKDVPADVGTSLSQISANLDKLAGINGAGDAREVSRQVAESLNGLMGRTGFTTRPALTELINQYRAIGASNGAPMSLDNNATLKLLAARTYTLLKTEIATTSFKL